jgi:hypothetical protein
MDYSKGFSKKFGFEIFLNFQEISAYCGLRLIIPVL